MELEKILVMLMIVGYVYVIIQSGANKEGESLNE